MDNATHQRWLDQLAEYDVEAVILDRHDDGEWVKIFQRQPAWSVDFEDAESVVFVPAIPGLVELRS